MKLLGALLLLAVSARAQFYAPPVDFHDVAQRRFPVEAARVLAWLKNKEKAGITDVRYEVTTTAAREIVWSIEWKANGPSRRATVRYPETALRGGADWYRDVWSQLTGADWVLPKESADDLAQDFWDGAAGAGLTRTGGMAAAVEELAAWPKPTVEGSAWLAGTLVQAAVPVLGGMLTIDGSLMGRSAAWLCVAEQRSETKLGALWAPLFALAGRGPEARAAWGDSREPERPKLAPVWRSWDLICRMPPAREALPLISKPENRLYAMPVFEAYRGADDEFGNIFARLNTALYPKERRAQLIDYGASMNAHQRGPAYENGARDCLEGAVKLIRQQAVTHPAEKEVQTLLAQVQDFDEPQGPLAPPSPALTQFLSAGFQNAGGPLNPVAVVTARDLLAYAWESTAHQFRWLMRHLSLSSMDKANQLVRDWYTQGEGWSIFMGASGGRTPSPLPEMGRFEFIQQNRVGGALIMAPPAAWPKSPDACFRRRWLMQPHEAVEFALLHEGKAEAVAPLIRRLAEEAHPHVLGPALRHVEVQTTDIVDHPRWRFDQVIAKLGLRPELIRANPVNIVGPLTEVRQKYAEDPWTCAREMEKLHWESGVAIAPQHVFHQYVRAHAFKSANRFFDRWKDVLADWSEFDMTFGQGNFALGMLQGDKARASQALNIMRGTWDKTSEVAWALHEDRPEEAGKLLEKRIKDNPDSDANPGLQQFIDALPLIPALNDRAHPDHARALDAFPRTPGLLLSQWVLLDKAKLTPAEAERFLDPTASKERELVVLAVQGKVKEFEKLFAWVMDPDRITEEANHYDFRERELRGGGSRATLYAWLRLQLLKIPPPQEEPDLQPPKAEPLLAQLRKISAQPLPKGSN